MEPKSGRQQKPSEAKPKRVGRPPGQRPKLLPLKIRQRLLNLGIEVTTRDTTDQQLKHLISSLSSDLQRYQTAADHWQKKLVALHKAQKEGLLLDHTLSEAEEIENGSTDVFGSKSGSDELIQNEFLQIWARSEYPNLDLFVLPLPNLRLSLSDALAGALTETFFSGLLMNVSRVGNIFGLFKGSISEWAPITRLKPNFSEARARELWAALLDPINTSLQSLQWLSGPSSRAYSAVESMIADDDPDYDALDRRLLTSSDRDVLDMLHYSCLMLMGLNHALYDNPHYENVRVHLGRQMERLLCEAVFTRNLGAHTHFASELYVAIIDSIYHFTATGRFGALQSLQEIAWRLCTTHPTAVHPILKSQVLYQSTIWASNPSLRQVWLARSLDNLESADQPYFHIASTTYFAGCYVALANRDLESLLHYIAKLDVVLSGEVPELLWVSDESSSPSSAASPPSSGYNRTSPSHESSITTLWPHHEPEEGIIDFGDLGTSPSDEIASRGSTSSTDTTYDSLDQRVFIEADHSKTCLQSGLKLLRAEASLLAGDTDMCIHWVDEAEKEILKLPDLLILQKMFVQESPCIAEVFRTVCPFPAGTHTIAEELERRVSQQWQPHIIDADQPLPTS
jgi:hypothetical protein